MSDDKTICLKVNVQPHARKQKIQKIGESEYKIHVLSPPTEGRANRETIAVLASHFRLPPSRIRIAKGQKSRQKLVVLEY